MPSLHKPHDTLFQLLIVNPERAAVLIKSSLPEIIAKDFDFDQKPIHMDGTLFSGIGRVKHADAVFQLRPKFDSDERVFFILEHKSRPEPYTRNQVSLYAALICVKELENQMVEKTDQGRLALPPIIRFVFYHGLERWKSSPDLKSHGSFPKWYETAIPSLGLDVFIDICRINPKNFPNDPVLRSVFLAFARAFSVERVNDSELDIMTKSIDETRLGVYLLVYIGGLKGVTRDRIRASMNRNGVSKAKKEKIVTNADNWWQEIREESEAKGKAEGKAEGKVEAELKTKGEILTLVLTRRFGDLSEDTRRRIDSAETPQLDIWIDSMIDAASLSDVFESASGR